MTKVKVEISNPELLPIYLRVNYSKIMEEILNSEEFKLWCLPRKFRFTNDSGVKVYETLMAGKENWNAIKDDEWDVTKVVLEKTNAGVVGHCFMGQEGIYSNLNAITSPSDLVGNLAHEMCHFLSYTHPFYSWGWWGHRFSGVPYDVGYYFRDAAKKLLAQKNYYL
jgi:hypothetical protein